LVWPDYMASNPRSITFKESKLTKTVYLHYVRDDRIICCQIFCDLLLKSACEQIFIVMQLILVKIKWKYLIKKFHICLSYYFKHTRIIANKIWNIRHETDKFLNNHCQECVRAYLSIHDCLSFLHEVMIDNHRNKTTES
jgi:hypothetical protein